MAAEISNLGSTLAEAKNGKTKAAEDPKDLQDPHNVSSGTPHTSTQSEVTVLPQTSGEGFPPHNSITESLAAVSVRIISCEELHFHEELGSGYFSNVYKALWTKKKKEEEEEEREQTVAVKVPKVSDVSAVMNDLKNEIEVLSQLNHQHIIKLLGITSTNHFPISIDKIPMIVLEFIKGGHLHDYLKRLRREYDGAAPRASDLLQWKLPTLLLFCAQIAEGMQYMEEHNVIHRDLCAENILVESEQLVKISDFGLARQRKEYYKCNELGDLPVFWYGPEILTELKFTHKSDVWSFGVVMWEVFTLGDTPLRHWQQVTRGAETTVEKFERLVCQYVRGAQLPKPPLCSEEHYTIMKQCWMLNGEERPTFADLVVKLKLQS